MTVYQHFRHSLWLMFMSYQVGSSGAKKSPLPLFKSPVRLHRWSFEEERALVEFVGLALMDPKYGITSTTLWPAFRPVHPFWTDAARHIQTSTSSSVLLTSEFIAFL